MHFVVDSRAKISGSRERHVQSGSRLTLSCRIEEYTGPPAFVFWYRNSEVINYSERKSILIRSGNLHKTLKSDRQHLKRNHKSSTVESTRSSLMPTPTFMPSSTNTHTNNTSKNSDQVAKLG